MSYIASVLQDAGTAVAYESRFLDRKIEEPYASRLQGKLQFADLESAMRTLVVLDAVYREYREASDRLGASLVRDLVIKGKQRAESLAANPRLPPAKREEKHEIAQWFHVWLEVPDLFFDWVEIRQGSQDFRRRFSKLTGNGDGTKSASASAGADAAGP